MSANAFQRREFLRVSAALGGGLLIGFHWPSRAAASSNASASAAEFKPNAFVRISNDGRVTVIVNKAEMGQGVATSLAMIVAEELDADWKQVGFEFAPADIVYAHPGFGIQMTGGSTSVAGMMEPLRMAGATARATLIDTAAKRWGVPFAECSTEPAAVVHEPSGKRATYAELVDEAAKREPLRDAPLKDPIDFRIIGKSHKRLDTPAKVAGTAEFALDVDVPGMLTALVAHPPVFGAKVVRVRADAASAVAGVKKIVDVGSGVAVIATGFWAAKQARDLLEIDWELGAGAKLSSDGLREEYRALARKPGLVARTRGDAEKALKSAQSVLEADYELPYLAHAPMEPLNCVVDLRVDSLEIWAGSQFQTVDQGAAAHAAGLKPEQVALHTTFLGGGFGRRANPAADYIVEAVQVAKHAGAPVKLIWTREDDMRGGYYRPLWHSRVRAALGSNALDGWTHTIVGQSILAGTTFEPFFVKNGIDGTSVEGAEDIPYAIANVQVELHTTVTAVPTLWWRSVGHSHTAFVVESFIDEVAHALGKDPFELRRELLKDHPRHAAVLAAAAKAAGWDTPLAAGRGRGIAVHHSFGSYVAAVAEVSLEHGRPRVHRYTCAIDCGRVVNPDGVVSQLEGAVGFGLTAALYSEITLRGGRVEQSNFHDYPMLRIHEMPEVKVVLVDSTEPPSGVGEPGVPPIAPALCNALFALTKKRIRRLPIRPEDLRA